MENKLSITVASWNIGGSGDLRQVMTTKQMDVPTGEGQLDRMYNRLAKGSLNKMINNVAPNIICFQEFQSEGLPEDPNSKEYLGLKSLLESNGYTVAYIKDTSIAYKTGEFTQKKKIEKFGGEGDDALGAGIRLIEKKTKKTIDVYSAHIGSHGQSEDIRHYENNLKRITPLREKINVFIKEIKKNISDKNTNDNSLKLAEDLKLEISTEILGTDKIDQMKSRIVAQLNELIREIEIPGANINRRLDRLPTLIDEVDNNALRADDQKMKDFLSKISTDQADLTIFGLDANTTDNPKNPEDPLAIHPQRLKAFRDENFQTVENPENPEGATFAPRLLERPGDDKRKEIPVKFDHLFYKTKNDNLKITPLIGKEFLNQASFLTDGELHSMSDHLPVFEEIELTYETTDPMTSIIEMASRVANFFAKMLSQVFTFFASVHKV